MQSTQISDSLVNLKVLRMEDCWLCGFSYGLKSRETDIRILKKKCGVKYWSINEVAKVRKVIKHIGEWISQTIWSDRW